MNALRVSALALLVAGCGAPTVSVKQEWTRSILSYSFIPLYPMREDVFVGDIRIHRLDAAQGFGLHSRPLARLGSVPASLSAYDQSTPAYPQTGTGPETKDGKVRWTQSASANGDVFLTTGSANRLRQMSLPKVSVTRISHADTTTGALPKLWRSIFGARLDNEEKTIVSLTGLETVEIPDVEVAAPFKSRVKSMLDDEKQRLGICIAALSMGDPGFKKTAISVVTRVGYARGAEFLRKSETKLAVSADDKPSGTGTAQAPAGNTDQAGKGGNDVASVQTTKELTLYEVFDRPLAFGVDAIMINPRTFYDYAGGPKTGRPLRSLVRDCKGKTAHFEVSPASPYLTGAPNRTGQVARAGAGKR